MKSLSEFLQKLNSDIQISEDKVFIISDRETLTLKSLDLKSTELAKKLSMHGVDSNDVIPILSDHSPHFIVSLMALWKLNAVPAAINMKLSAIEIDEQLKFLNSQYVLADNSFAEKVTQKNIKIITPEIDNENLESNIINFDFNMDRTAIIIFTSGSSGKPKAVELSFSNLIYSAQIGNQYLKQTAEDRWLASLPFYHIGGFSIIFRALMFGTKLILQSDLKIQSVIQSLDHFKPTLISLVSSQMKNLLNKNINPNKELRHVLLGGGFVDSNLMQEAINKQWPVSKVYGSTETSSFVTLLSPEEFERRPESAGKAVPPNEIFIIDLNGNELSENSEGEIGVKSAAVMKGYFNDEDSTYDKIKNGLYFTEDYGYKDSEGYLYVVNRRTDLIVTGGENVNPLEVEKIISKYPKVREVCIVGIDDEIWGQKIVAAIVPKPKSEFSLQELKVFLKDKLASFKIPKEIFFLNELPKTELGKIKRERVKNMFS